LPAVATNSDDLTATEERFVEEYLIDLNGTANTPQTGSLSTTAADLNFAAGDRASLDFANTIQSTAGCVVTLEFAWL